MCAIGIDWSSTWSPTHWVRGAWGLYLQGYSTRSTSSNPYWSHAVYVQAQSMHACLMAQRRSPNKLLRKSAYSVAYAKITIVGWSTVFNCEFGGGSIWPALSRKAVCQLTLLHKEWAPSCFCKGITTLTYRCIQNLMFPTL